MEKLSLVGRERLRVSIEGLKWACGVVAVGGISMVVYNEAWETRRVQRDEDGQVERVTFDTLYGRTVGGYLLLGAVVLLLVRMLLQYIAQSDVGTKVYGGITAAGAVLGR